MVELVNSIVVYGLGTQLTHADNTKGHGDHPTPFLRVTPSPPAERHRRETVDGGGKRSDNNLNRSDSLQ